MIAVLYSLLRRDSNLVHVVVESRNLKRNPKNESCQCTGLDDEKPDKSCHNVKPIDIMTKYAIITTPFLIAVARANDDCKACVDQGCTYCANSKFGNPSTCNCNGFDGFFGDCNDVSFGSEPLESSLDCTFGKKNGEMILAAIIVVPALVLCVIVWCACFSGWKHVQEGGKTRRHTHTTGGTFTTTPGNTVMESHPPSTMIGMGMGGGFMSSDVGGGFTSSDDMGGGGCTSTDMGGGCSCSGV